MNDYQRDGRLWAQAAIARGENRAQAVQELSEFYGGDRCPPHVWFALLEGVYEAFGRA